ncbi:MAG: CRISPR-associated helicase Cas3', partial [Dehalococcoidia bacterium]
QNRWHDYHDFQIAAGRLGPRALLLASCGAGKTLAAWKWIANQAESRQITRALFLYPTRATATEGFRDYVSWAGPDDGALLSGTARYDLDGIFANAADWRREGDYSVPERLFALAYWDRAVFSATVDSFLAFIANRYAPLCLLPLLAEAAIVIDEVHSFDRQMFKALERFLRFFDIPVLCMTASLPSDRLQTLRDVCGLEVFPADLDYFDDLDRQARAPRYAVRRIAASEAPCIAANAVRQGKRVLWVVNTVQRCQEAVLQLRAAVPNSDAILCYHSRFRLQDRKQRHEDVIRRFRSEEAIAVITTQVCEMSLDLDADVLISETAPVPALIQRMGRCCREPLPRDGRLGEVCIYDPPGYRPYEAAEIAQGQAFATSLSGDASVSQWHLNACLEQLAVLDPHVQGGYAAFIDSGWYALSREDGFREDDDFVIDAVLDIDRESFLRARRRRDPAADGYIVPAPRKIVRPDAALGDFVAVVRSDLYTRQDGLRAS